MDWLTGILAFGCLFLYDYNRIFLRKQKLKGLFSAGCLLLVISGSFFIRELITKRAWFLLAVSAVFLLLQIYTLFFALPFDETYRKDADNHKVCRTGLYGICRHPGLWSFFGCFLSAAAGCKSREKLILALVLCLLNICYSVYQDYLIFPKEFSDHASYMAEVPFLIPGKRKGHSL